MLSEIGSNFWINPNEGNGGKPLYPPFQFGYKGSDYAWMSTGRSATRLVLQTIEERNPGIKKVAIIPPFTCYTVFEPFMFSGYEIHTLPISLDLTTTAENIIRLQEDTNASVLLVHRYYGFNTLPGFDRAVIALQKKGVIVIEDCTQCLYSDFKVSEADYIVCSIRKWCGVPDGGFAICKDGVFQNKPAISDEAMVDAKREASELKYRFLFEGTGDKPTFKAKYREAEDLLDKQEDYFTIGKLSETIQANLDVAELKNKRKENYQTLLEGLRNIAGVRVLFEILPQNVTPLYFPVLVKERESLQNLLADNDIYAPVVWPKAENSPKIGENAEILYKELLCIPVDQRYDRDDMERIISILLNYWK